MNFLKQIFKQLDRFARIALDIPAVAYHKIIWAGEDDRFYKKSHQLERLQFLRKEKIGKVLEIGCSTGGLSSYLNVDVGIDIDRKKLLRAKLFRSCKTKFMRMNGKNLKFANNTYDTVILSEVLEHAPKADAKKMIKEAVRVASKKVLSTIPALPRYASNPQHIWIPIQKKEISTLFNEYPTQIFKAKNQEYWCIIVDCSKIRK